MELKSLESLYGADERLEVASLWNDTEAADEFAPVPAGEYLATAVRGELTKARTGTRGYKVTFAICEGEFANRKLFVDFWLTEAAMPMTKRDLLKLGVTNLAQLERPLPDGIKAKLKVVVRRDDDGVEYNRVRSFTVTA